MDNENLIRNEKRTIVSKVADARMAAAARMHRMVVLIFPSFALSIFLFIAGDWNNILVLVGIAGGFTFTAVGIMGWVVYWEVFNSLLGEQDTVEISRDPDPRDGPPIPPIATKPGIRTNHLTVGPVRLTVLQFRKITQQSKANHWKWSRVGWQKSGANVVNLNKWYGQMLEWMKENNMLDNLSTNPKRPSYEVNAKGQAMLNEVCGGRVPGAYGGQL